MIKVLVTTKLDHVNRERLVSSFKHIDFEFHSNKESAIKNCANPDVLVAFSNEISEEWLGALTNLKWVHALSSGVDSLPFEMLKNRNILVTNSRGVHAIPMAEYTIGVMLLLSKRLNHYFRLKEEKKWENSFVSEELEGKVVGIIGTGAIGSEIAKKLIPFNTKSMGINSTGNSVPNFNWTGTLDNLNQLLSASDFVIMTLPLTDQTKNLLSDYQISLMKPSSYLINLSRGEVINEQSLIDALKDRKISGAVLDVFETEPLPKSHQLWDLDNVIITPHISDSSNLFNKRVTGQLLKNLFQFSKNEYVSMINLIDLDKYSFKKGD